MNLSKFFESIPVSNQHIEFDWFFPWKKGIIKIRARILRTYYGKGFNSNPFPDNPNIEVVAKEQLERALINATRNTSKGEYHKIRHGPDILATADHTVVCGCASHYKRLFETLQAMILSDNR